MATKAKKAPTKKTPATKIPVKVAAKKIPAKKVAATPETPATKLYASTVDNPVTAMWEPREKMKGAKRKDVVAAAQEGGIVFYTVRAHRCPGQRAEVTRRPDSRH